jgi:hypothetical protein
MKLRLTLFFTVLAVVATTSIHVTATANSQETLPTTCVVVVPSDWGEFKGIAKYGLVFEDKAGTLRLIEQMPCSLDRRQVGVPKVSVELRRD